MRRLRGETMIELMVAVVVISIGLFTALNLVYSNLALVDRGSDEVVAINLAREGVEIAKQVRDSNWLAGNVFNQGMSSAQDYTATIQWTGATGTMPSFNFTANTTTDPNALIYLNAGLFQQTIASGSSTGFARIVVLHPICNDFSVKNSGSSCSLPAELPQVGVRVESVVQWTRKQVRKTITLYSDFYDWR